VAAGGQSRLDDLGHVLGPGGGHQQGLGPEVDAHRRVEDEGPHPLPHLGPAGLAGQHGPKPVSQEPGLGGLAGGLAALEGDEPPPHCSNPPDPAEGAVVRPSGPSD
jgi:hypothetical protein